MLVFEKSRPGRGCDLLPASDVEIYLPEEKDKRELPLHLPELSEGELSRHYTELAKKSHGVNDGFYPLGSCTMKYNPKINEDMAYPELVQPSTLDRNQNIRPNHEASARNQSILQARWMQH